MENKDTLLKARFIDMTTGQMHTITSMVSPTYPASKLVSGNINDWIDVFEDRMKNWIFIHAHSLLKNKYYHYAITCLIMPYFESIATYLTGKDSEGHSKSFFKIGFVSVFADKAIPKYFLEREASVLYEDARCGFFHDNMTRSRIFFHENKSSLSTVIPILNGEYDYKGEIRAIIINPKLLLNKIEEHFNEYVKKLRDGSDNILLQNFRKIWEIKTLYGGLTID